MQKRDKRTVTIVMAILALACVVSFLCGCCPPSQDPEQGPPGVAGAPGVSQPAPQVTTVPATASECSSGGTDIVITIPQGWAPAIVTSKTVCNGDSVIGPQGPQGDVGSTGPQGVPGAPGSSIVGPPGADGTKITMVSFCGGPSVYPSNFPEYGIVIGSDVFGVYSTNGGFLALLPPGAYISNAVGSSCTFTINTDGTVSR